jgi:hypothetical protein
MFSSEMKEVEAREQPQSDLKHEVNYESETDYES